MGVVRQRLLDAGARLIRGDVAWVSVLDYAYRLEKVKEKRKREKRTYRRISRKWTLLPEVTLNVPPPCASSILLIGAPRSISAVIPSVLKSHHLSSDPLHIKKIRETYLTKPSSEAETPVVPDCPSSQTNDLIFPSVDFPSALFPRTRGSASGLPRSNKRIFFS
jgi:hypothetical protein